MLVMTLRDILRYILDTNMSNRAIGRAKGISFNTVRNIRLKAITMKLDLSKVQAMDDAQLEALFHVSRVPWKSRTMPDLAYIHRELQKPSVTIRLLWQEYRENGGDYSESQYAHHIRKYLARLDLTMRKVYLAGEWMFSDYAGKRKPKWTDPVTGEEHEAELLVGCLPCSNYAFAYATKSQSTEDTAEAHIEMFQFFGGVAKYLGTDNLKAVVLRPGKDPEFNKGFQEVADYHGILLIPTRVRHPQDKGKVEVGVQVIQRWVLARLRNRHFNSLAEINVAIRELLILLNDRPFRHLPGCRRSRFMEFDQPALKPLPAERFIYGEWIGEQKVGPDYHIKAKSHYYSVHYSLVSERVEVRVSARTVEVFHRGKRVASHMRNSEVGGYTTLPEHRPTSHRAYLEQTPDLYLGWAKSIGPHVAAAVEYQLESKQYSPLALRGCSSLQRLAKDYGPERLEAACRRGQQIRSLTLKSISSILQSRLDCNPEPDLPTQMALPLHDNVRGAQYYS